MREIYIEHRRDLKKSENHNKVGVTKYGELYIYDKFIDRTMKISAKNAAEKMGVSMEVIAEIIKTGRMQNRHIA